MRVLCVEDDADIRAVAELALVDVGGCDVKMCESGRQALVEAPEFQPDVILLDVMMPEMDGPETLRALRKLDGLAAVPVIFMTARIQGGEIQEYLAMGAVDVIPKPFDPMILADEVRAILAAQ
ncbi:MAG: response regulator [Pseudomonadota bacterium]|nr:response regulator [Pseudomonadota bacterium]